jgi:hypothetical protein
MFCWLLLASVLTLDELDFKDGSLAIIDVGQTI